MALNIGNEAALLRIFFSGRLLAGNSPYLGSSLKAEPLTNLVKLGEKTLA